MRVAVLTPYYTPRPTDARTRAELTAHFAALATQPGPAEIILAAAVPERHDTLTPLAQELTGDGYPHQVRVLHLGFDPSRQRPASRGAALNEAAAAADSDLLLLLHVDVRLPNNGLDLVRQACAAGSPCGAFPKQYWPCPPLLAAQAWWLNAWHLRVQRRTVGTNAVWLDRALWQPLPTGRILEDFALSDRLRREGLHVARQPVTVDSGKYLLTGLLPSIAINAAVIGLYRWFRADPDQLADELYSRRALAVCTPAFWPRLLATTLRIIRESLRG